MLTSKQASVELNVSRLERGLAIMRDVPWRKREATDADTVLFFFFLGGGAVSKFRTLHTSISGSLRFSGRSKTAWPT